MQFLEDTNLMGAHWSPEKVMLLNGVLFPNGNMSP